MDTDGVIEAMFGARRALVGMLHVPALPGTPRAAHDVAALAATARAEAETYAAAGFHGLLLENMHDRPYLRGAVGPEVVAALAVVARAVGEAVALPTGIQILAGANREALAVAHAAGASFVRVEGFVFAHVADEGIIDSDAGDLLRYRRAIGADRVKVFADIKKKHSSHALTADVNLVETARAAELFLADGLIVTGLRTAHEADPAEVAEVAAATALPTLVGSGITAQNVGRYGAADALIVGSSVKRDGLWSNPLDRERLDQLVAAFHRN